jgi:hypothetical protein
MVVVVVVVELRDENLVVKICCRSAYKAADVHSRGQECQSHLGECSPVTRDVRLTARILPMCFLCF